MILGYKMRLIFQLLAFLFWGNLALGVLALGLGRVVRNFSKRLTAASVSRIALALRLLPFGVSLFIAASICLPSYLRFEQKIPYEEIGLTCVLTVFVAQALWLESMVRTAFALVRLRRFNKQCQRQVVVRPQAACEPAQWLIESGEPIIACTGILKPRIIVANRMRKLLPPDHLSLALAHEWCHARSFDNLKRLLMVLVPDVLPFARCMRGIEQVWEEMAEWAADDYAVNEDPRRALALAETLMRVAKLNGRGPTELGVATFVGSFAAQPRNLSRRVERLLVSRDQQPRKIHLTASWIIAAAATAAIPCALVFCNLSLVEQAHNWLEQLVR